MRIVQEIEMLPYKQMVYAQPRILPRKWDAQTPLGFWDISRSPNLSLTTKPNNGPKKKKKKKEKKRKKKKEKKKRTCRIVHFAVPADHRVKLRENEKRNKYQVLSRELKKPWNMKVTIIPIVTGVLGTVTKDWYRDWRIGNKRTSGDHPNDSIAEIGWNSEKSHGDLKRLAVTQTLVENHQRTQAWKLWKE